MNEPAEFLEGVRLHAELFEAHRGRGLIEDSQDGALAVHGGHDGNADIYLSSGNSEFDSTILRQAALSDIHLAENLNPGNKRGLHALGRAHDITQHAIDSVANFYFALVRLDVDITCSIAHGLGEDEVDHLHDGGFARHLLKIGKVGAVINLGDRPFIRWDVGEDFGEEALFDEIADLSGIGEHSSDGTIEKNAEIIHRLHGIV